VMAAEEEEDIAPHQDAFAGLATPQNK
jgi:hypothetical protein